MTTHILLQTCQKGKRFLQSASGGQRLEPALIQGAVAVLVAAGTMQSSTPLPSSSGPPMGAGHSCEKPGHMSPGSSQVVAIPR